ncbi:hypothetical protein CYMTET_19700 [Cymbomonas tetramitiformis]|uniref:Uncharacterized protein n=1 Tax=Cymbomonas tetramitiformis TaxID=36881 RepID=A0AAE0G5L4_9CHLO|nr:hypothetical protein CYMTET_19700 [Cymbomonas tetramitiformis]
MQDVLAAMLRQVFDPASVLVEDHGHHAYSWWKPNVTVLNFDGRDVNARKKRTLHGPIDPHRILMVPCAMKSFGGLRNAARKFFDDCVRRGQDRLIQEDEDATWTTRNLSTYWLQRISVALRGTQGYGIVCRAFHDFRCG